MNLACALNNKTVHSFVCVCVCVCVGGGGGGGGERSNSGFLPMTTPSQTLSL